MMALGFVCKILLAVACLVQATVALRKFNDLIVKTNVFVEDKSDAFYQIPTKKSSPTMKDYVQVQPEADFKFQIDFYCKPNDPRVCFMYDKAGNVAGVQISFLKTDVSHVDTKLYDYEGIKEFVKTNFFNTPAYSSRVFFTDPEKLTASGRQNPKEVADGLWAYLEGKLVHIQREQPTGLKMGDFDKQGCYPAMGQHYIYKYNKDSICKHHYGLFPLYEKGSLVGYGIASPAKSSKYNTDWYERPSGEPLKNIIINTPPCEDEIVKNTSFVAFHVFLVDNPANISCP